MVSTPWVIKSTQSTLRTGSPGLDRMLPSPLSALRERNVNDIAKTRQSVERSETWTALPSLPFQHVVSARCCDGAASVELMSSGSAGLTGSVDLKPESARNVHFTTGAAACDPYPD